MYITTYKWEKGELPENMAQLENEYLENSPIYEIKLVHTLEESGMLSGTHLWDFGLSDSFLVGKADHFTPFVMLQPRYREQLERSSAGPSVYSQYRELKFLRK